MDEHAAKGDFLRSRMEPIRLIAVVTAGLSKAGSISWRRNLGA
jgi:hypothetical protein